MRGDQPIEAGRVEFLVWTFPLVALVAAGRGRGRRVLGLSLLGLTLLTQLGFPSHYWELVRLQRDSILLLVARNLGLLAVTILAVIQVHRLGGAKEDRRDP